MCLLYWYLGFFFLFFSPFFFFFNDTATTEIYTLSLHDALPICPGSRPSGQVSGTPVSSLLRSFQPKTYSLPGSTRTPDGENPVNDVTFADTPMSNSETWTVSLPLLRIVT